MRRLIKAVLFPLLVVGAAAPLAPQTLRTVTGCTPRASSIQPKYPKDFKHFDYVNPDAPKGGTIRLSDTGTFDSLNFVPPKGTTPSASP